MKLTPNSKLLTQNPKLERGSATILVLALLAIMAVFLTTNQRVLHNLKREVRLVEQQQLKKFQPSAKPAAPPARP